MPAAALLVLWAGINAGWMADWWLHRAYTLRESSQWLAQNLQAGSVLLGDVAPGLAMDTRFQTVNVMKGFANDARPVEEFGSGPAYVLTIDGAWKTPYWTERYPEIVDPARRIRRWRVMKWTIGLYAASGGERAQRDNTSYTSASALEASGTVRRSGLAESVYAAGRARAGSSF